jgi:vancomycin permeability regulator SanA
MYFALSKLLVFSIKPLNWVVVLLIIAAVCRAEKWRKRYLRTAAFVLVFCSNPWIINQLILRWETGHRSPDSIAQPYPVGIVLGGFMNLDGTAPPGNYTMLRAGNRLLTAMQLYHQGKIKRILISGGAGRLLGTAMQKPPLRAGTCSIMAFRTV